MNGQGERDTQCINPNTKNGTGHTTQGQGNYAQNAANQLGDVKTIRYSEMIMEKLALCVRNVGGNINLSSLMNHDSLPQAQADKTTSRTV